MLTKNVKQTTLTSVLNFGVDPAGIWKVRQWNCFLHRFRIIITLISRAISAVITDFAKNFQTQHFSCAHFFESKTTKAKPNFMPTKNDVHSGFRCRKCNRVGSESV